MAQTGLRGLGPQFTPWLFIDNKCSRPPRGAAGGRTDDIQSIGSSLIKISSPPSARRRSGGGPAAVCLGRGSVGKHQQILSRVTSSQLVFPPLSQLRTLLRLNSFSTLAAAAPRTAVTTPLSLDGRKTRGDPTASSSRLRGRKAAF